MIRYRRVYITGFMGCGKTTAGKKLAAEMQFSFIDLDHEIERREQRRIEEIFTLSGEEYFRKAESAALHELDIMADTVISTGGGTPCFGDNLTFMKETGVLIYLKMTPLQLKNRLEDQKESRPLLKGLKDSEMINYIARKLKERGTFYEQASIVVDGMTLDIKALSKEVLSLLP
jgi:shikimate kinase